jgi:hypothetical protein
MSLYLFLFNPLHPLLTLLFDICWTLLKAWDDARPRYQRIGAAPGRGPIDYYIAAAIGMHADQETKSIPDGDDMSVSLLRLPPSLTQFEKEETSSGTGLKQAARVIGIGLAAVQCSLTILLGIRRELRSAATPSDRRYYLFAASGLAILAQTLVAQLLSRKYRVIPNTEHPSLVELGWSIPTEILHYLGSLCVITYLAGDDSMYKILFVAAFLLLLPTLWPWGDFAVSIKEEPWTTLLIVGLPSVLPLLFAAVSMWFYFLASYNPYSDRFTDAFGNPVPTNVPCPSLWTDPLANSLYAF